jgi:CBS-domain-containing membrane protein
MSLALAQRLMDDHRLRHLPGVQEGQLVGLVSDRDIRQALPSLTTTLDQGAHLNRKLRFRFASGLWLVHEPEFALSNGFSGRFMAQNSP